MILEIDGWWRENRLASPDLFADELADAFVLLRSDAEAGQLYPPKHGARRLLLRASRDHAYFRIAGDRVIVIAVWSAVRNRGPRL